MNKEEVLIEEYLKHNSYYGGRARVESGKVVGISYWKSRNLNLPNIPVEEEK